MNEGQLLINGLKINYRIAGNGPAVLILHGWGSKSEKWQRVGESLDRSGISVVIPDLPGFGNSQKPSRSWNLDDYCDFVEQFIKFLKLERFFLLGHSFGGALAIKFSLKFPEKVKKLFLVAPSCIRKKTAGKLILNKISKIFKTFSFLPFYSLTRKGFYKFVVKSDYLFVGGIMKESYLKIIKEDLSQTLSQIQVPAIIIWGEKDDVVPIKNAYLITKEIKNSKLIIIPGGNHDLEQKIPDVLVKKIKECL